MQGLWGFWYFDHNSIRHLLKQNTAKAYYLLPQVLKTLFLGSSPRGPMTYDSTQDNFLRFEKLVWRAERPDFGFERSDLGCERLGLGSERLDLGSERPDLGLRGLIWGLKSLIWGLGGLIGGLRSLIWG